MRHILGISAFYHDSAAALLRDGCIVAAAQEERFSRKKNDPEFPRRAAGYCLRQAGLEWRDLDALVFYDKPVTKFARLLETYLAVAPAGWRSFGAFIPSWLAEKLNLPKTIREELPGLDPRTPIFFSTHHQAHAASAFYPSPFGEAAILTVDGVGEWSTTTIARGSGASMEFVEELRFPHSLGLLYSAFTAYCGFRINSGEYKLMGLAPYGEPRYRQTILDHLLDLRADGSFRLDLSYFGFLTGFKMTNRRFDELFGGPPREPEAPIEQRHTDVARSIQAVTEEAMLGLARRARAATGSDHLCLAGGVALNCVANGRILREGRFKKIWIQPAAGDAGGALGAALAFWHSLPEGQHRPHTGKGDAMQGSFLGPDCSEVEIEETLRSHHAVFERLDDDALIARAVALLQAEKVVGWVRGRMEFGPRALGNRSILGDARSARMQSVMNLKVKFRESFRPFAPVVRRERAADYFDLDAESPYMLLVAQVRPELRIRNTGPALAGLDRLKEPRSTLPAVTHVDGSARVQTVAREANPMLYRLLEEFERATECGVLINTSFNVRGEPIVRSADDAYRCFVHTEMDHLFLGNFVLDRLAQPKGTPAQQFERIAD
jgi:carbamoyltransferase